MQSCICICSTECGFDTKNITPPCFTLVSLFLLAFFRMAVAAVVVLGGCHTGLVLSPVRSSED